jgi:hypothetical protein
MNNRHAEKLLLVLIVFMAMVLDACQSHVAKTVHYAGQVNDSKAFIAIATNGTDILAYVCDGTETDITIAEWFKGTLSGKSFSLTSKSTAQLTGQIEDGAATGTLTLADGSPFSYTAPLATGNAGLYRKEVSENGSDVIMGWIVLKDGEMRGGATLVTTVGLGSNVAAPKIKPYGQADIKIINSYYFVY